jgi:hypothetical protein
MATINQYALTTLANVREALGFETTESGDDNLLINLINRVTVRIESYCGRKFKIREYTEYQDGESDPEVFLDNPPIDSISQLWDDTDRLFTDSANDLIVSGDYIIYSDEGYVRLFNNETVFSKGYKNIKIVYSGGYTTIPEELEQTCMDWVLTQYRKYKDKLHGWSSKSYSGVSVLIDLSAIPSDIKAVLDNYKLRKIA